MTTGASDIRRNLRHDAMRIVLGAIEACDPHPLTVRAIEQDREKGEPEPTLIFALGKGAFAMQRAAIDSGLTASGIVVGPAPRPGSPPAGPEIQTGWETLHADHPIPTARNIEAAARIASAARGLTERDHLLVLMSGGASAHLVWPAGDLGLDDLQAVTGMLLRSGASIDELNTVRKHLERLKGGRLGAMARCASVRTLVLCDVLPDASGPRLDMVSSGPTIPDATTYAQAIEIIERRLGDRCPEAVRRHLTRGEAGDIPETPAPGDPALAHTRARSIGDNTILRAAAANAAEALGYRVTVLDTPITGPASEEGRSFGLRAVKARRDSTPSAMIAGGETTVDVGAATGRGGRNQEFALASAQAIRGVSGVVVVSIGSDGVDGPTDAAGAIVDGGSWDHIKNAGRSPDEALRNHDSHPALDLAGDLVRTGPTGSNLNDLMLALIAGESCAIEENASCH